MSKDLDDTRDAIDLAIQRLRWLKRHLPELESLAYEKATGGDDVKVKSPKQEHYGDEAGSLEYRREWLRIRAWLGIKTGNRVKNALVPLMAICVGVEKLLMKGREDDSLQGSTISISDFEHAKRKQAKRGGGAAKLVEQPKHPREETE